MKVYFQETVLKIDPKIKSIIKNIAYSLFKGILSELYIVFTDDNEIRKINSKVFSLRRKTDVISLLYTNDPKYKMGEIFISIDTAKENARLFSIDKNTEIIILAVHGLLHLKGMDDGSIDGMKKMSEKTLKLLKNFIK